MKRILWSLVIVAAAGLSGCGDDEAREYAAKMIPVLDSYQEQLSQKIKAEQDSYDELAEAFEEAREADIRIRLAAERVRRSEDSAEEFTSAKEPPTLSQILASVQKYAKTDFEATQGILQEGLDARSQYLNDLEGLEVELQKVKALKEALKELSKDKSDFKKFKGATEFLLKTDEGINKLLCADLKKQLGQLEADLADAGADSDEGKKLKEKVGRTKERMSTKKCSDQ